MKTLQEGFKRVKVPGRLEQVSPNVILSGDHNWEGLQSTMSFLRESFSGKLRVVCGFGDDKPWEKMLKLIENESIDYQLVPVKGRNPSKNPNYLNHEKFCSSPLQALEQQRGLLKEGEMLLVTGSLYLVAELYPQFRASVRFLNDTEEAVLV